MPRLGESELLLSRGTGQLDGDLVLSRVERLTQSATPESERFTDVDSQSIFVQPDDLAIGILELDDSIRELEPVCRQLPFFECSVHVLFVGR